MVIQRRTEFSKPLTRIERILMSLVYWLGPFCYRLLCSTYRIRHCGLEARRWVYSGHAVLGACWHQRLFCIPFVLRNLPRTAFIVSQSKDGEMIRYVLEGLGFGTFQGSSSRRGGPAFLEMARHLSAGGIVGITPDGPKGPAREVQAGTPRLAVETGATIVPVAVGARRCWFAPSWDRFLFPHPFAQVSFHWGEPIPVRKDGGPDEVERVSRLLKQALDEVTAEADRAWGRTNAPWRRAGKGAGAS